MHGIITGEFYVYFVGLLLSDVDFLLALGPDATERSVVGLAGMRVGTRAH